MTRSVGRKGTLRLLLGIISRIVLSLKPYRLTNHVFVHRAGDQLPPMVMLPGGYRFIFPADPSVLTDSMLEQVGISKTRLEVAMARGDQLAIVLAPDGTVAHRSLVKTDDGAVILEGDRHYFDLRKRQAYVHYCETAPIHRGKGLYPFTLQSILRNLQERHGVQETWIACRTGNLASIAGIHRSGFTYECSLLIWGVMNGRARLRHSYLDRTLGNPPTIPLGRRAITNERTILLGQGARSDLPWSGANWLDFASGQEAIVALVRSMALKPGTPVLLPAFVPEGLFAPFHSQGMEIHFYPLDRSLDPRWESLQALVVSVRPRLAVFIHHFGLSKDVGRFAAICRDHGVPFLEDMAQAQAVSESPRGKDGDFVLFSLTKVIGVPDGAILVTHRREALQTGLARGFDPRRLICLVMNSTRLILHTLSRHGGTPAFWALFHRCLGRAFNSYRILMGYYQTPNPMSFLSHILLDRFPWKETLGHRRRLEQLYREGLDPVAFRPISEGARLVDAAMGYAVFVDDREGLAEALRNAGIHGIWFEQKWDYFPGDPVHREAIWAMKHHFLFPTAYSIAEGEVRTVIGVANRWAALQR